MTLTPEKLAELRTIAEAADANPGDWITAEKARDIDLMSAVADLERLAEKAQWHYHPRTGDKVIDTPQVRVTAKGLAAARDRLIAAMQVAVSA